MNFILTRYIRDLLTIYATTPGEQHSFMVDQIASRINHEKEQAFRAGWQAHNSNVYPPEAFKQFLIDQVENEDRKPQPEIGV